MTQLPERINVMKVITYDVPSVVESLKDMEVDNIDLDAILYYIEEWAHEDFGGVSGLIFQDEDGNEL